MNMACISRFGVWDEPPDSPFGMNPVDHVFEESS